MDAQEKIGEAVQFYDAAATLWQGKRSYQEDAINHGFSDDKSYGFVVLADGMGGHTAGDVASALAVEAATKVLQLDLEQNSKFCSDIDGLLTEAVVAANSAIAGATGDAVGTSRMGTTLLVVLFCEGRLYWTSVGDSPLYLWRQEKLLLLNEDHSLSPLIDQMVATGEISEDEGRSHPDRNVLTSVVSGEDIRKVDLSSSGYALVAGDLVLVASDGLQYIDEEMIAATLRTSMREEPLVDLCDALIAELQELDHPHQDNVSLCIVAVAGGVSNGLQDDENSLPSQAGPMTRPLVESDASIEKPTRDKPKSLADNLKSAFKRATPKISKKRL